MMLDAQEMSALKIQYETRLKTVVLDHFQQLEVTEPPAFLYHFMVRRLL